MILCNNCVGGIDRNRHICSVCNGAPEMPDAPVEEPKTDFVREIAKKVVKRKK